MASNNALFVDATKWTLDVLTPPDAAVSFSGGPSGTVDVVEGETAVLTMTTILQNTGGDTGTFSISASSAGGSSVINWASSGVATVTGIKLAPGSSVSISWQATVTGSNPAVQDGTYTTQAAVSWTY